jgi:threonine dehydrogenase-like Zn-dependent dehydrogenase
LAEVKEGCSVAIWGLGPIGLLTARWCQLKKAKTIIGIDHVPERLELGKKLGIRVINFDEEDVYTRLR